MSSLLETLRQDQVEARKQRNGAVANLLGTVVAECETFAKAGSHVRTLQDHDVLAIVQRIKKGITETLGMLANQPDRGDVQAKLEVEAAWLERYLPPQLTDDQINDIAVRQNSLGLDVGQIMQHLRRNYPGQYDAKQAIQLVRAVAQP